MSLPKSPQSEPFYRPEMTHQLTVHFGQPEHSEKKVKVLRLAGRPSIPTSEQQSLNGYSSQEDLERGSGRQNSSKIFIAFPRSEVSRSTPKQAYLELKPSKQTAPDEPPWGSSQRNSSGSVGPTTSALSSSIFKQLHFQAPQARLDVRKFGDSDSTYLLPTRIATEATQGSLSHSQYPPTQLISPLRGLLSTESGKFYHKPLIQKGLLSRSLGQGHIKLNLQSSGFRKETAAGSNPAETFQAPVHTIFSLTRSLDETVRPTTDKGFLGRDMQSRATLNGSHARSREGSEPPAKPRGDVTGPVGTGVSDSNHFLKRSMLRATLSRGSQSPSVQNPMLKSYGEDARSNSPHPGSMSGPHDSLKRYHSFLSRAVREAWQVLGLPETENATGEAILLSLQRKISNIQSEYRSLEIEIARLRKVQTQNQEKLLEISNQNTQLGSAETEQIATQEDAGLRQQNLLLKEKLANSRLYSMERIRHQSEVLRSRAKTTVEEEKEHLPTQYLTNPLILKRDLQSYVGLLEEGIQSLQGAGETPRV